MRPNRYLPDHAAALHMPVIAKSVGADPHVYGRNQLFKLPNQKKIRDLRVQAFISGELTTHIVTAYFDKDATPLHLSAPNDAFPLVERRRSPATASAAAGTAAGAADAAPSPALGPWTASPPNMPKNWDMTSPAL